MKIPSLPKLSRKIWIFIIAIILIIAAIPALGLVHFTSTNQFFCLTCHQNQEPVARWLPSRAHPTSVTCKDCHTRPGEIIPRKFSASDDFMNNSCLRCHSDLSKGEQTDLANVRVVKISHKLHAEKKAICLDCHRNIGHDSSTPRTNRPQMETCYQCHQAHPRTQACDKCHPINLVYSQKGKTS
jgi:nitrate/TMAO reductase-like tetraheme cytochrome c subunit